VLAAAAGVSDIRPRRYLAADVVGALVTFAITVTAGYSLGRAYERGGVWLTAGGVVVIVGLVVLLSRWLRAEAHRPAPGPADPDAGGDDEVARRGEGPQQAR
jgi:membrane protein DedA with SNARE-associated domain